MNENNWRELTSHLNVFMGHPFFIGQRTGNYYSFADWSKFHKELSDVLDVMLNGKKYEFEKFAADTIKEKIKRLEIGIGVVDDGSKRWFRLTVPGGGEVAVWWAIAQFGAKSNWSDSLGRCVYGKCGKYFIKDRRDQKYCSDSHRYLDAVRRKQKK